VNALAEIGHAVADTLEECEFEDPEAGDEVAERARSAAADLEQLDNPDEVDGVLRIGGGDAE